MKINIGDKYYYTGDQANIPDFGVILNIWADKWGEFFTGKLDDGRLQEGIYLIAFNESPGQRFKTIEQYNSERQLACQGMMKIIEESKCLSNH